MTDATLTIAVNEAITPSVCRLVLKGDLGTLPRPGQFVNLSLPGFFLRRPISVCDAQEGRLTLIYKVVGEGTRALCRLAPGRELKVLTPLGTGYDLSIAGNDPVLFGGGVGVPPLYYLAKNLISQGKNVRVVLGFQREYEIFYEYEFTALGCGVTVFTDDGSNGNPGFVTDGIPADATCFYACGPMPMLKALCKKTAVRGEVSLEERMGCGFGACMGCSVKTKNGYKRVCKEGPVFTKEEIVWEG